LVDLLASATTVADRQMPDSTGLSNIFAAAVHGRSSTGPDRFRVPATGDGAVNAETAANREPADLSLAGHVLLPVTIFVVTLLTIDFLLGANFAATIWPANAIILVALLRHTRNLRNYSSIIVGSTCAIALANVVVGNSAASSAIFGVANIFEVAVTLAFLSVLHINAANLTSFKNLLIFMAIAGGVAPAGSNAVNAILIGAAHGIPWRTIWLQAYPAHALGMVVVAPFLISVTSGEWHELRVRQRLAEAAAIFAFFIAIGICGAYFRPFAFLTVPAILFSTLRFGLIGATAANLLTALFTSSFVLWNIGEPILSRSDSSERILAMQVLLAFTSLWCLPIAALLTERDRLLGDLSLANAQLKTESETKSHLVVGLRRHLSIAEERERLRLSYELHDQAGQDLIAAILELNEIDSLIDVPARERLHLVRKKMEELGKTLHRIAWELRPPAIDELGLRKALASYIADWGERCGTEVDFHCDDPNLDEVPNEIGTTVYRIVQEGLTNILKHAQGPSDVSVVIRRVGATLQVIIEDNGCGFDVGAMAAKPGGYGGLGLDGMRGRLILIGGTLEVESAVDVGTTIFARIALDSQRSAA
jgi:signal transduction histidine kinase